MKNSELFSRMADKDIIAVKKVKLIERLELAKTYLYGITDTPKIIFCHITAPHDLLCRYLILTLQILIIIGEPITDE